jgi:hypothetical protein
LLTAIKRIFGPNSARCFPAKMTRLCHQKSWKSLDAASMVDKFAEENGDWKAVLLDMTKDKLVDDLGHKQKLNASNLPLPCKFLCGRRAGASGTTLRTSYSVASNQFEDIFISEPSVEDMCDHTKTVKEQDVFFLNDTTVGTENIPRSQHYGRRNFRKVMNFAAGLQNEAERRRQVGWKAAGVPDEMQR